MGDVTRRPGWRSSYRHCRDRCTNGRSFREHERGERPAACGPLGFALADAQYADKVIVVTDNLVPFPCIPWQINGNYVDYVVVMDKIGIPEKIVSGTTEITKSPDRLLLAEWTAQFCDEAGLIYDGFSFQAGAGGTALSIGIYFSDILRERKWKARFARGGSNKYLVKMLEEGLVEYILDGQTFDLDGVRSMRDNPHHDDKPVYELQLSWKREFLLNGGYRDPWGHRS